MAMQNNLSLLIKERRILAGLTLSELAARCGLSASYLSRIERGTMPGAGVICRLAGALGIDTYELLSQAALAILTEPDESHQDNRRLIRSIWQTLKEQRSGIEASA